MKGLIQGPPAATRWLHCRCLLRSAALPPTANSPWPLVAAGVGVARSSAASSRVPSWYQLEAAFRKETLESVRTFMKRLRQQRRGADVLSSSQLAAVADKFVAFTSAALGLLPPPEVSKQSNFAGEFSFGSPAALAVGMLQREVLLALSANSKSEALAAPVPYTFAALRSCPIHARFKEMPTPTWRMLLAGLADTLAGPIDRAVGSAFFGSAEARRQPMLEIDVVDLLAAYAAWPLGAALADEAELARMQHVTGHCWKAAELLHRVLSGKMDLPSGFGPAAKARCAVARLTFAQYDGMVAERPRGWDSVSVATTEGARVAAAWLRSHPDAALQLPPADPPNDVTAPQALVRLLSWLATGGPIATASAVLGEALPARRPWRPPIQPRGSSWPRWEGGGSGRPWLRHCGGAFPAAWQSAFCRMWRASRLS